MFVNINIQRLYNTLLLLNKAGISTYIEECVITADQCLSIIHL